METNDQVRRRRLRWLCEHFPRGREGVASKAGVNSQTLYQLMEGALLPPKADGSRSERTMGDALARKVEGALDLGNGWFDWPFEHVDFLAYSALTDADRAYVQGKMAAAIEEVIGRRGYVAPQAPQNVTSHALRELPRNENPADERKVRAELERFEINGRPASTPTAPPGTQRRNRRNA